MKQNPNQQKDVANEYFFLCVANSARSQMAEGLAKSIFGKLHNVQSAGSKPTHISTHAIEALQEIGIDISKNESKNVDSVDPSKVDLVITLCEEEVCPAFFGKAKKIHWPFPDPARIPMTDNTRRLEEFRKVRDGIMERIRSLNLS